MAGDGLIAGAIAWLATYAVHGAVLCAIAAAISLVLPRLVTRRRRLAAMRESLWKLAIFGGLATATLATAGAGGWKLRIGLAPEPSPAAEAPAVALPRAYVPPAAVQRPIEAQPEEPAGIPAGWMDAAMWFWIAAIALGAAAWLRDRGRIAGRLRGRVLLRSGLAATVLADLRRRTGARSDPELWLAPGLASPISLGILRPAICIPPHAETALMRDELEAMLAHELAHVERRDAVLLSLCRAVEVLLFVQPFLRFARSRLVREIEIGCDELAAEWTGDPAALASCLAEVATWIVDGRRDEPVLAMAAHGSRLEQRVHGLLDEARRTPGRDRSRLAPPAWVFGFVPLALGGITLDARAAEPRSFPASSPEPVEVATIEELAASADELQTLLEILELEYAAIAADPLLESADERIRESASAIGARIQALRAASARLDALLSEGTPEER